MASVPNKNLTSRAQGSVGSSQAAGTLVCSITPLGPGRYQVWGNVRHSLADGVRLVATGQSNFITGNAAGGAMQNFGPINMDLTTAANTVLLELQQATGASDVASGNLYVEKIG